MSPYLGLFQASCGWLVSIVSISFSYLSRSSCHVKPPSFCTSCSSLSILARRERRSSEVSGLGIIESYFLRRYRTVARDSMDDVVAIFHSMSEFS